MRVSGFTFVRNAVRLDYPVVESIRSILPIVDELVVNVGDSDDQTKALIGGIGNPKVRIVESRWNPNMRDGGYVLAQQTNIALLNCTGAWAIYLQSDEAIHERDHARLVELMQRYRDDDRVEGLVLQRLSFYGDYQTVFDAYPLRLDLACRVVKPHRFVLSRGDAASFTVHPKYKERGRRIRVVDTGLSVFHYMDVRSPNVSAGFVDEKSSFWEAASATAPAGNDSRAYYYVRVPRQFLAAYKGTHPAPMHDRIRRHGAPLDMRSSLWRTRLTPREKKVYLRTKLIELFGIRLSSGRTSRRMIASHRTQGDTDIVRS